MLFPVLLSPKPTILPKPLVVRNHASIETVFGAWTVRSVAANPDDEPLNAYALLPSEIAPFWLRLTPPPMMRSLPPRSL